MKKTIIALGLILVTVMASAKPVDEQQARLLAGRFFSRGAKAAVPTLTLVKTGVCKNAVAPMAVSAEAAYYVYDNADGGFVIIAGDNAVEPVLAYSLEGSFPVADMPDGLRWWLDTLIADEISYARAKGMAPCYSETIKPMAGTVVTKHQTAQWNQSAPYNGESPTIDGHKTITGCVATAASIKARFHKWPYKGSGKIPAYTYFSEDAKRNVTIPENQLGRVYDYDNMPLSYSSGGNSTQNQAVAALMYDMGCVAKMQFGWSGSGAYTDELAANMVIYMHYSKSTKYRSKSAYSDANWQQALEAELDANGPIIYDGHSSEGGHCFIFDGYTDDHYYSVNWGWGGSGNGYYKVSAGSNFPYAQYSGAVLNCIPDKSGIYTPDEIAEATDIVYSKMLKKFSYTHKKGAGFSVNFEITDAEGKTLDQGTLAEGASKDYPLASLKGVYKLNISVVNFPDVVYSVEFEF